MGIGDPGFLYCHKGLRGSTQGGSSFLLCRDILSVPCGPGKNLCVEILCLAFNLYVPITYTVIAGTLARVLPKKILVEGALTLIIVALIFGNYISTQVIVGQYYEVAELQYKDLEAGKILTPPDKRRIRVNPNFMSSWVWSTEAGFNSTFEYYKAHRRRCLWNKWFEDSLQ